MWLKGKCTMHAKLSRYIAICEFDEKFDIWFKEDTIAQTFSSYSLIAKVMYYQILFTELKSSY